MGILTRSVTLNPAAGKSFVTITTGPATGVNTIHSDFPSIAVGMQVEWDNTSGISISNDGTVTRSGTGSVTFDYRVWQGSGSTWTTTLSFDFVGLSLTGQAVTASYGTLIAQVGGTYVALSSQLVSASQGAITSVGNANIALTGQIINASQGVPTPIEQAGIVLTGQAITGSQGVPVVAGYASTALTGQSVTSGQGALSVSADGGVSVGLVGQPIAIGQGTPTVYSSIVTIALVGEDILVLQGPIVKVDEGTVYSAWIEDSPVSDIWTPENEVEFSWAKEAR